MWPSCDDPPRIGVIGHRNRLEIFGTGSGKKLGQAPEIDGVGRIVRTARPAGWPPPPTAGSCSATSSKEHRPAARPQPRRAHPPRYPPRLLRPGDGPGTRSRRPRHASGRWIWKHELDSARSRTWRSTPDGFTALTTEVGSAPDLQPRRGPGRASSAATPSDPALLIRAARRARRSPGSPWPAERSCSEGHDRTRGKSPGNRPSRGRPGNSRRSARSAVVLAPTAGRSHSTRRVTCPC